MSTSPTPLVFQPLALRSSIFRNRLWLSPMCQYSVVAEDGAPTDWHLVHLGARASGGFGLVMAEATAVAPEGRISLQDTGLWTDKHIAPWSRISDFVHSQGAVMGIQLAHAGRKCSSRRGFYGEEQGVLPQSEGGWRGVGPSPLAFPGFVEPQEASLSDIRRIVDAFANAARRADVAGVDVVEIHAAHGYLLHSFLSPLSNQRSDAYGGSEAKRCLLVRQVVAAVREVWPETKPLFVRLSASEWVLDGWGPEQATHLAATLADEGVDLIDVSSGGNVMADIPVEAGYQVPLAAQVRHSGVPVAAVGLITQAQQAEDIVQAGSADAIFVGRVGLREPSWPQRVAFDLGVSWKQAPYPGPYQRGVWR